MMSDLNHVKQTQAKPTQTQIINEISMEPEPEEPQEEPIDYVWGRLYPLGGAFQLVGKLFDYFCNRSFYA